MLIINADDFGLSRLATDRILECHKVGSVTSASAMVFMKDSDRAAELAKQVNLDVGLHLNFSNRFTGTLLQGNIYDKQMQIIQYINRSKYSVIWYNPFLRQQFNYMFQYQLAEFERLYGFLPSHIDGHQHKHLCMNILLDGIIPKGYHVRRHFTFLSGEKSSINRLYRKLVDIYIKNKYLITDYFYSLESCLKNDSINTVYDRSKQSEVELMVHPENSQELEYLTNNEHILKIKQYQLRSFIANRENHIL